MSYFAAVPSRPPGLNFRPQAFAPDAELGVHAEAGIIRLIGAITEQTPKKLEAALRTMGGRPVTLQVNSRGGDFYAGVEAHNVLRAHSHLVESHIVGIAASAASVVAIGADEVAIARDGKFVIHSCHSDVAGDAETLREVAEALDAADRVLVDLYTDFCGLERERVAEMVRAGATLVGQQAVDLNFADRVLEQRAIAAPRAFFATNPKSMPDEALPAELEAIAKAIADAVGKP